MGNARLHGHAAQHRELAVARGALLRRRRLAVLGDEGAAGAEDLHPVVGGVGHVDAVVDVDVDAVGPAELAVRSARGSPAGDGVSGGAELDDAVVAVIGHVDVAGRVGGCVARSPQLVGAVARGAGAEHAAGGGAVRLVLGDLVLDVLADQDDGVAELVDAGRDADRGGERRRPCRQHLVRDGVHHLHALVAEVGDVELAVEVGDVARVVEVAERLRPALAAGPQAGPSGA